MRECDGDNEKAKKSDRRILHLLDYVEYGWRARDHFYAPAGSGEGAVDASEGRTLIVLPPTVSPFRHFIASMA